MNETYIVDWDLPMERRRMFYYYLEKIKKKHEVEGSMSSQSVMMVNDSDLALEVYDLASKYGRASIYHAELLHSNNHHKE